MRSSQPVWQFVANLGDANPVDYGGLFVFTDSTGRYEPEMERLSMDDESEDDETRQRFTVHRALLERCTFIDGILSENKYHPGSSAWFSPSEKQKRERPQDTHLGNVASYIGSTEDELREMLCSADPLILARAYEAIFDYHGWANADSYPLTGLTRAEVEKRYADCLK